MTEATIQAEPLSVTPRIEPRLRLWPAVVIVLIMAAGRTLASFAASTPLHFSLGFILLPMVATLALTLWWSFASRLRWSDRLGVLAGLAIIATATVVICGDAFPAMGMIFFALPILCVVWVGWLLISMRLRWPLRRACLLLSFVATGLVFCLLRIDGMDGAFNTDLSWRWTPTAEERLLTDLKSTAKPTEKTAKTATPASTELTEGPGDWPAFRGADRAGQLSGVSIETNWEKAPPREVWRHRIGPGWSSVTVIGDHLYTQEQRGDDEYVVCYHADTGAEIWTHLDKTRFTEIVAGAGPRSTPTFHAGRLYSLGANGRLNCLDAASGKLIWTRDIVADTKAKVPQWGFSSSPLIAEGLVSVFAGGPEGKSVVAYNIDSGELAWAAGQGELSYCSTQLSKVCGIEQLLITTDAGLSAFQPKTGEVLWHHDWPSNGIARVVQPAVINETDVLIGTGLGIGSRLVHVDHKDDKWTTTEAWTVRTFKPYFNDLVVTGDHAYGFDGNIFMCVSLKDGRVKWRARGYGNGEVLLLGDQKLLVVLTEQGEVVLVNAQPDKHEELTRIKAIEGKTWNHPVIAHGKLFVRNAQEIACFELPTGKTVEVAHESR